MVGKQYLISFIASVHGQAVVISGLQQMEMGLTKVSVATNTAAASTTAYGMSMMGLAKRALMVIPIWLGLRAVFMLVMGTIRTMITTHLDLEDGMARIRTVMHGEGQAIAKEMSIIKESIMQMAVTTQVPVKELAEAFYFLKTANLDVDEAMALFIPTVNAMVATGNNAKDTARAMAGMYNTMGESLGDVLTLQQKAIKIADILTYTYATQDVQLDELISGYTKLAPYLHGLSDTFEEMVTVLGVLNTNLLRSGRTGRLLGRTILQITKNSRQLAEAFGVVFDPDKPISLLKTIEAVATTMRQTTRITFEQQQALQRVFATRGGIAPRILIEVWDDLEKSLKNVGLEAEGFAEKMREIREETTRAQFKRLSNNIGILFERFMMGALGGETFAKGLKRINDELAKSGKTIQGYGSEIGWLTWNLSQFLLLWKEFEQETTTVGGVTIGHDWLAGISILIPSFGILIGQAEKYQKIMERAGKKGIRAYGWGEYLGLSKKAQDESERDKKLRTAAKTAEEQLKSQSVLRKQNLSSLRKEQEITKHNVVLMKMLGVNGLEIANQKLKVLENERIYMDATKYSLELEKRRNKVIEEQLKFKTEMVRNMQSTELFILKAIGVSELNILEYEKQQIIVQKEQMGDVATMDSLYKNHLQTVLAKTRELQIQKRLMGTFAEMYHKADENEKARIRRAMELRQMTPEEVVSVYKTGGFDERVIDEYKKLLTTAQQEAIEEYWTKLYRLPTVTVEKITVPEGFKNELTFEIPQEFWKNWIASSKAAVEQFREQFGLVGAFKVPIGITLKKPNQRPKKVESEKSSEELKEMVNKLLKEMSKTPEKIDELKDSLNESEKRTQEILKKGLGTA